MNYEETVEYLGNLGIYKKNSIEKTVENSLLEYDKNIVRQMESATKMQYSDEQRNVLLHRGNINIIACAGSGKTTTIAHLISKRIKSGEINDPSRMVCTTFSKDGATDLSNRVKSVLKQVYAECPTKDLRIGTLHSYFLELLRTFGNNLKVIGKDSERMIYVKGACKNIGKYMPPEDVALIGNVLSYQVNCLRTDEQALKCTADMKTALTVEDYANIRKNFSVAKANDRCMDFDDIQLILYKWVCLWQNSSNPQEKKSCEDIRKYCSMMYHYYFIDESQDISKIQFNIIKALTLLDDLDPTGNSNAEIVFIGDDDQSIYSWRGSDSSIILSLEAVYVLKEFKLTTNRRCASSILQFSRNGIENNQNRYPKEMKALNKGGSVEIAALKKSGLIEYTEEAVKKILEWTKSGVQNKDIAILVRNNSHACLLSYMLAEHGIYCKSRNEMKLCNMTLYQDLKDCLSIVKKTDYSGLLARVLWKLVPYMSVAKAKKISNEVLAYGLNLIDYLKLMFTSLENSGFNASMKSKATDRMGDILNSNDVNNLKGLSRTLLADKSDSEIAINLLYTYGSVTEGYLYKSDDSLRTLTGVIRYMALQIKEKGLDKALDDWNVLEQLDKGTTVMIGDKIEISTIHSAKGREWSSVILMCCDYVGFPSACDIASLDSASSSVELDNFIDEERRLFYVGCTRAKNRLYIETSIDENSISPFVYEACGAERPSSGVPNEFVTARASRSYPPFEIEQFKQKIEEINVNSQLSK